MLIGDYTMQCRKHLGTCICRSCSDKAEADAASERRRWYYEQVLSAYAQELRTNPKQYADELRDAERFVEALRAEVALRPTNVVARRVKTPGSRSRVLSR